MKPTVRACQACNRTVLDVFASLAGISLHSSQAYRPVSVPSLTRLTKPRQSSQRAITTSAHRLQQPSNKPNPIPGPPPQDAQSQLQPTPSTPEPASIDSPSSHPPEPNSSDPSLPWYLNLPPPSPPPLSQPLFPHLAAQALPPLPPDAPLILSPLLNRLSNDIGLDNLSILDLRDLSPPSALGANLIMILGTARSTKHLNTSADRFCRWVRAEYGLRPYADGLLGRQELKVRLRRRNRRMKLAREAGGNTSAWSGIGGDGAAEKDYGIGTGWICVNVGDVGAAEEMLEMETIAGGDALGRDGMEDIELDASGKFEAKNAGKQELDNKQEQETLGEDEEEYTNPKGGQPLPVESVGDFKYAGFGSMTFSPKIVVQMFTEEKRIEMDLEGLWEGRIRRKEVKEEKGQKRFEYEQRMDAFETSQIEEDLGASPPKEDDLKIRERKSVFETMN